MEFVVKQKETTSLLATSEKFILAIIFQIPLAVGVCAQTAPPSPEPIPGVAVTNPAAVAAVVEADAVQKRMERARGLAAAHQLVPAAMELESIRASAKDEVVRNNSSLMLMGIYLEDGNYARAESLLEETFKGRSQKNEASLRTYFALAGQAVNGARAHVARYRVFGINVSSQGLPAEAVADLERLRSLLERMSAQGRELIKENGKANDAFALLEDISLVRTTLARDTEDRTKWETEHSAARAKLATLPTEIASLAGIPAMAPDTGDSVVRPASVPSNQTETAKGVTVSTESRNAAPTPPAPGSTAFEVGSLTDKATSRVTPVYPQLAKNAGVSGLVRIKIVVDEGGSVSSIVWSEGPMLLRQAAQDALRQWKFQPLIVEGKPVKATGYVDFGFSR
jgi:TonB family protein